MWIKVSIDNVIELKSINYNIDANFQLNISIMILI